MPLFRMLRMFPYAYYKAEKRHVKHQQRDVLPATSILRPSTAVLKMLYALPTLTGLTPD
jgi:hypothetical protein